MDYDAKFFDLLFALKMVVFKIFWLLTNRVCSHLITPSLPSSERTSFMGWTLWLIDLIISNRPWMI